MYNVVGGVKAGGRVGGRRVYVRVVQEVFAAMVGGGTGGGMLVKGSTPQAGEGVTARAFGGGGGGHGAALEYAAVRDGRVKGHGIGGKGGVMCVCGVRRRVEAEERKKEESINRN